MPTLTDTKTKPRPKPVLVRVNDLTGGLDRRVAPSLMKSDRARRLRNARLSIAGEWQPRPGWAAWLTSQGSGRVQGAQRVYLDGVTPFALEAFAGSVYKPSDGGVLGSAVLTGLDTSAQVYFPYDPTLVAVFDGVNVPKKSLDGVTWTQFGISPPASAPTIPPATAGGSLVTGHTYSVSYVYRSAIATSNEGPAATQSVSGANLTLHVIAAVSADPQVTDIDFYAMDVTAGEDVRRFAGTVANSGTPAMDITANTWSAEEEAPTQRTVPSALLYGVVWKNRWWAIDAADQTVLRFSQLFENQSWPVNYNIEIPFTRGDRMATIIPLGDTLVVFGQSKQAFVVVAQTSLDFEVRPSAGIEGGTFGPRAADILEDGIAHAGAEGVYVFNLVNDTLLSRDFDQDWRAMVATSNEADQARIAVCYHRRDKELRLTAPLLPIYGTAGEYVLDLIRTRASDHAVWATTDRPVAGYLQWDGAESVSSNRGRLFTWDRTVGKIDEESTGTSADGDDLVVDYEGPVFSTEFVNARFLEFFLDCEPNTGTLALQVRCGGATVLQTAVDIAGALAFYGIAEYGEASYGGGTRRPIPIELPLEAEGHGLDIVLQYEGQAPFTVFEYGFTAKPEPVLRGM